jgi:tetratricopeptide (TPR) repeat protein
VRLDDALALQRETARLGALTCLVGDVSDSSVLRIIENIVRRELRSDSVPPPSMAIGAHEETRRYTLTDSSEGDAVERHLGIQLSTPGALRGSLAEVPFASVLVQIFETARHRRAGAAVRGRTRAPPPRATAPRRSSSSAAGCRAPCAPTSWTECLGQILCERGIIEPRVLHDSLQRARAWQGRQGAILLSMGAITPHQLREALEYQQETKLLDVFGWPSGTFEFAEMEPPQETATLEMSLFELVMCGVRERVPPARVAELLAPALDRFAAPVAYRVAPFRRFELPSECRALLDKLDGRQTVRGLLGGAAIAGSTLAAFVYTLVCVGAIKLHDVALPLDEGAATGPSERQTDPPAGSAPTQELEWAQQALRLGQQALAQGAVESALEAFARATTLAPDEGLPWVYLGYCRHTLRSTDPVAADQALAEVVVGCRLVPNAPDAHLLRARLLRDRGKWPAARNAYERVLHLDPDHREALDGLRAIASQLEA